MLDQAQAAPREYAADQSDRAGAHHAMRDRIMAAFRRRQGAAAGELADEITEIAGSVVMRLDDADSAARRRGHERARKPRAEPVSARPRHARVRRISRDVGRPSARYFVL